MRVRKRQARRTWVLAVGSVACAGIVAASALHRPTYAFLERFHPRRYEVDADRLMASLPPGSPKPAKIPKLELLEFRTADAVAVFKAMRSELTPARGYVSNNEFPNGDPGSEAVWEFAEGSLPPPGSFDIPRGASTYLSGTVAVMVRQMYLQENVVSSHRTAKTPPERTCIVILAREPGFLEGLLTSVQRFLHLN